MVAHRVAVLLLVLGVGVWGGAWSVFGGDSGTWATRFVGARPAATGALVDWGPQMVSAAAQVERASTRAARLVIACGAGVLGISLLSTLLLFSASRTATRPALRVHRAVGASMRRLRRGATVEAISALGIATLGAGVIGVCVANAAAWYWSRSVGVEVGLGSLLSTWAVPRRDGTRRGRSTRRPISKHCTLESSSQSSRHSVRAGPLLWSGHCSGGSGRRGADVDGG